MLKIVRLEKSSFSVIEESSKLEKTGKACERVMKGSLTKKTVTPPRLCERVGRRFDTVVGNKITSVYDNLHNESHNNLSQNHEEHEKQCQ
jgi:hypothetical protein